MAVTLPLRNQAALDVLLHRIYNPGDSLYQQFLTPAQFTAQFSPSASDYADVADYLQSIGLTIVRTWPNRTVIDVAGASADVERAFGVRMYHFVRSDGSDFHAPATEPLVSSDIAGKMSAIVGLDDSAHWQTHTESLPVEAAEALSGDGTHQLGTGPGGAYTPGDIRKAYSLQSLTLSGSSTALNGAGQSVALMELAGYNASDIGTFTQYFGLPNATLRNVLIDGDTGAVSANSGEVVLDIELALTAAPALSNVLVYEAPNTGLGVIDVYNRIVTDNLARQVSTSWGVAETSSSSGIMTGEDSIFKQMAAQGQSIYAAAGDSGAYDNGTTLSVDDPASQPYVTGVGGTELIVNPSGGSYESETTWNDGSINSGAGGGGVSAVWPKPTWQSGVGFSAAMRNVPDVSLDADPYTGYSIYYDNGWYIFGGTSCAAPLWAGFTALVNQQRAALGAKPMGFAAPALYAVAEGPHYAADFHDIADGSTNLYYPATKGYDDATGWGSYNGANLVSDLSGATVSTAQAVAITNGPSASPSVITAAITWTTNTAANATVSYGVSAGSLSRNATSGVLGTSHQVLLAGLLHRRTYYYVVTSSASAGSTSSAVKWFTTN
jgi:subtilase family serine protease